MSQQFSPHWGIRFIVLLAVLALWEGLVAVGMLSRLFFPPPSGILSELVVGLWSGEIGNHAITSISRLVVGFGIGGVAGFMVGIATGMSARARWFIDPLIAALHPIPKVAILPLLMIVIGIGEGSKLAAIAISGFFPVLISVQDGIRQIDTIYFQVAGNLRATKAEVIREIVIPATTPVLLSGIRIGINTAFLVAIAVELVSANRGLGALLWISWETLHTEMVYAALAIVSLIGVAINQGLQVLFRRLVPWQTSRPFNSFN